MKKLWAGLGLLVMAGCLTAAINLQQVNTTSVQTLSNKTLASPVVSGTITGTYTLGGTPTLTSPTISNPTFSGNGLGSLAGLSLSNPAFSGTSTGTWTLGGAPTLLSTVPNGHNLGSGVGSSVLGLWLSGTIPAVNGNPAGLYVSSTMTGFNGNTAYGAAIGPTINKPSSGTATEYASMVVYPPTVGAGAGSVTSATTLNISGAPTGAVTNNRALWISGSSALSQVEGTLQVDTALSLPSTADITAVDEVTMTNASANATAAGRLRRNGASLTWHDGSSALALLTQNQAIPNPIINGNMEVWQRGTAFAAIGNDAYSADRWSVGYVTSGVATINRSTNVPSVAQAGVLFNYSLEVDVTTADAAVAAGDHFEIQHRVEGYNWRHFAQREFTVSFWVMSSKTGAHGFSVTNSAFLREYLSTFTINVADTWEYKTITIPASPSAGTWDYINGVGLRMFWSLMAGSSFQGTATGAWQTLGANVTGTSAQPNVLDSTSNFFRITGVKMELGPVATPIQFVPFEAELQRCMRYYQKSFRYTVTPAQSAGVTNAYMFPATSAGAVLNISPTVPLSPPLRLDTGATMTLYNPSAANAQIRNVTDSADLTSSAIDNQNQSGFRITATGTAGTAVGEILAVGWTADAEL